jgi:hypothetical protein
MNIDVWRDEDGSKILPPMAGATDERMAEAVELSHTIIICVSNQYKSSANCRQEGKYANTLFKRGKLNIVYVMMDQKYTTVSSPDYVDGWLGIMVGDSLWYPLWNHDYVNATATEIANCMKVTDISAAVPTSPVQAVQPTTSSTALGPLDEAWQILSDQSKVTDMESLTTLLNEIGLSTASELLDCDEDEIQKIADFLKSVPKKKFVRLIQS